MPVNKRAEPEAEKKAQLMAAARQLFVQDGYESTPMGRIAKAAGVTPNTIYWYFEDKDALLLAVLDELFQENMATFLTVARKPLAEQLLWLVQTLRGFSRLISTVHARVRESKPVDQWHSQFHSIVEQLFAMQLPQEMTQAAIAAEVRIAAFTVEGLVTHVLDDDAVRLTCQQLASRWAQA